MSNIQTNNSCRQCGGSGTVILSERDGNAFWNRCAPCQSCDSSAARTRLLEENSRMKRRITQLLKHRGHLAAEVIMDKLAAEFPSKNTNDKATL